MSSISSSSSMTMTLCEGMAREGRSAGSGLIGAEEVSLGAAGAGAVVGYCSDVLAEPAAAAAAAVGDD